MNFIISREEMPLVNTDYNQKIEDWINFDETNEQRLQEPYWCPAQQDLVTIKLF